MSCEKIYPSIKQLEFLEWEFGIFFHFGIRTFYEGHKDWDYNEMPLEAFNPAAMDCKSWLETAKVAGAKYAVFVAKHHDGFANWPSAYTEYSIKNTPYKDGKGDLVREFTAACAECGLKVGLYYSPAEFGMDGNGRTGEEYDDYFINQIGELLCNYGKIDYLWFDGCGSENHEYNKQRIISAIREWQPEIMIFNMWDPDTRWVGNEAGIAPSPCFNTVSALSFSVFKSEKDRLDNEMFLPAECDCRMRRENWFYSDKDEDTVKSPEELLGIYYYTVGRGANLLLNIGPDRRGRIPDRDKEALLQLGQELKRRFSKPIQGKLGAVIRNSLSIELCKAQLVNHLVLSEELSEGERVSAFEILVDPKPYGDPCVVYRGTNIGHKAICSFPTIYTDKITVRLTGHDGNYIIKSANAFFV